MRQNVRPSYQPLPSSLASVSPRNVAVARWNSVQLNKGFARARRPVARDRRRHGREGPGRLHPVPAQLRCRPAPAGRRRLEVLAPVVWPPVAGTSGGPDGPSGDGGKGSPTRLATSDLWLPFLAALLTMAAAGLGLWGARAASERDDLSGTVEILTESGTRSLRI